MACNRSPATLRSVVPVGLLHAAALTVRRVGGGPGPVSTRGHGTPRQLPLAPLAASPAYRLHPRTAHPVARRRTRRGGRPAHHRHLPGHVHVPGPPDRVGAGGAGRAGAARLDPGHLRKRSRRDAGRPRDVGQEPDVRGRRRGPIPHGRTRRRTGQSRSATSLAGRPVSHHRCRGGRTAGRRGRRPAGHVALARRSRTTRCPTARSSPSTTPRAAAKRCTCCATQPTST